MNIVYLDAIPGPYHHFAGLSYGNIASMEHKERPSNPKKCALQVIEKMKLCHDLGATQLFMPPVKRPRLDILTHLGFEGEMIKQCYEEAPHLLASVTSSSIMWMANSASVTPSYEAGDKRLHITPANCQSLLHRSIETEEKRLFFEELFKDLPNKVIHPPLMGASLLSDEGAANQIHLKDLTLYVYGRKALEMNTKRYYPRQCLEASKAICRRHKLPQEKALFIEQNPALIDEGVFHNDLIAFGEGSLLVLHEKAFVNTDKVIAEAKKRVPDLEVILVTEKMLPVKEAIKSYFFNSQLLLLDNKERVLLLPKECESLQLAWLPLVRRHFVDLSESMQNGGGPACLRLALYLTEEEKAALNPTYLFTDKEYVKWVSYISTHYPDNFVLADLLNKY